MLAIKECLIREGVLNLNANENIQTSKSAINLDALNYTKPPYGNNNNNNNSSSNYINWQLSKSNTITNNNINNMDALRYRKHQSDLSITKAASSDLSSASATAKTSCQQQYKQQQPQQHQQREEKTKKTEQKTYDKAKKIYSGHHPHFHHHTAPVYYTDVNLRIHTPNSADVAALNENYQSVYSTPSKLVGGEHYFPKTTTATVAPPPIGSTTATTTASAPTLATAASDSNSDNNKSTSSTTAATRAAFFRGDTAAASIAKNRDESQRHRRNLERYIQSMPSFANPTKGTEQVFIELQQEQQQDTQEVNKASLVFACTNFKPTTAAATTTSAAVNISPTVDYPANYSTNVALRSSRNPQRFNNRKRAVRVRSESRPISALYDIICKEKGLDIGTTTTNDEDSSSSSPVRQYSHGDVDVLEQQHQQQQYNIGSYRQPSQLHSLSAMSSSLGSPSFKGQTMSSSYETMPGQHQLQQQQQQTQHQQLLSSSSVSGSTSASKRTKAMRRKQRPQAGQRARSSDNDKNDDADGDDDDDDDGIGIGDDNNADEHVSTAVVGSNNADVMMTSSQMRQSAQHSKAASLPPTLAKHTHQQQQQQPKHFTQAISSTSADIISEPTEQIINQTDSEQQLRLTSNANGRDNVVMAAGTANNHKNLSASMLQLKMSPTTPSSSSVSANTTVKSRKLDKRYHTADGALLNTNNKSDYHQQQQYHHDHYYHAAADDDHDDGNDDNGGNEATSSSAASFAPQANSQSNAELLTNGAITASAKRFITRSSRAASRQSVNGQNYHSDSTTPSPTRQQQQQQQEQQQATHKSKGVCQSSPVNGNSSASASASASAYETAATTVMTHSTPTPLVQTVPIHPPPPTAAAATTTTAATTIETTESAAAAAATASSTAANAAGSAATSGISAAAACCMNTKSNTFTPTVPTTITATTTITITTTTTALKNNQRQMLNKCNSNHCNNNNNHNYNNNATPMLNAATTPLPLMPPLTTSITVLKPTSPKHHCITTTTTATAIATTSPKRRKNPLSPLRICQQQQQQQQQQLSLQQQQQQQQSQPISPHSPLFAVRTTKTTRLRAAALDKKKEEELQHQLQQQQRYSSPTSPRQPTTPTTRRASSCSDTQKSPSVDTTEATTTKRCISASVVANTVPASEATASAKSRLVPTVSGLAMKQNLSEMHFTSGGGGGTPTTPTSPGGKAPQQQQQVRTIHSDDCTVKLSPKRQQRDLGMRPRSSTMHKNTDESTTTTMLPLTTIELSPVRKRQTPESSPRRNGTDRDKSAKRKSNLNRSLNEEATQDGDDSLASRRRRRRELGMARTLVPNDDVALRELLQGNSPKKSAATATAATNEPTAKSSPTRSDLAMHMENARRGLDLLTTNAESERRRAQTASPKRESYRTTTAIVSPPKTPNGSNTGVANNTSTRVSRRSDTLPLSAMRRLRSDDVNNKLNERTKTDLAEIMKIAEQANLAAGAIDVQKTPVEREAGGHEAVLKLSPILRRKSTDEANTGIAGVAATMGSNASPPAHNQIVSILKKKDHGLGESTSSASSNASPVTFSANVVDTPTKQKRAGILKKRSSLDESRYYSRSHSPDERSILIKSARRNSLEETGGIVVGGSVGQMSLQQQQHGILKQSSYDSSKSDGCPSATESQPQSILKKKDSTSTPSDGGTHAPKHVSISQAVILAAAELGRCDAGEAEHHANEIGAGTDSYVTPNNEEYEIRPILKQESTSSEEYTRPKPILKKKSSGDSDEHEIRPILKTSRKSSREEFDLSGGALSGDSGEGGATVRPILKTDSPSKRRSLGAADATLLESVNAAGGTSSPAAILATATQGLLKRRTRSLERQDGAPIIDLAAALNAISSSQSQSPAPQPLDFSATPASVSVAERIRNMEMFLSNQTSPTTPTATTMCSTVNSSWESPLQAGESTGQTPAAAGIARPKVFKPSVIRRDLYRERFKTQPVTNEEMCFFKATSSPFDISSTSSAFRPTKPLDFGQQHSQSTQHIHQLNEAGPLISPIVGSAAFFHLNNTPDGGGAVGGSIGFKLARSQTQPVQSSARSLNAGSTPVSSSSSGSSKQQQQHFLDADSERIFDMSGLDEDSTMQSIGGDDASAAATSTTTPSAKTSGAGVSRSSSVRARANMFQQLQEQTRAVRETAGGARPQATGTTTTATRHSPPPDDDDDPKTPNTTQDDDEEVDPSSLSLAERLAFFSSLSGGVGGKGGANHSRRLQRSRTSSYTRSSPPYASMERSTSIISNSSVIVSNNDNNNNSSQLPTTPRSSTTTSGSSASITPTSTMDCSPILPAELREASTTTPNEQRQRQSSGSEQSLVDSTATTATPTTLTSTTLDLTDSMVMTAKEEAQLLDEVDEDWVLIEKETEQQPESMQHEQTDVTEAETETNNYVRVRRASMATTESASTETLTPENVNVLTPTTKRIKLRTVGKLVMPQKFLSSSNNHNNSNNSNHNNNDRNNNVSLMCKDNVMITSVSDNTTKDWIEVSMRKIGKIKSPFIEQQQQQQQQKLRQHNFSKKKSDSSNSISEENDSIADMVTSRALRTHNHSGNSGGASSNISSSSDEANISPAEDSGKENYDVRKQAGSSGGTTATGAAEPTSPPMVVELRKKLTRLVNAVGNAAEQPPVTRRCATRNNSNRSSSSIDERFAKFFGLKEPTAAAPLTKTQSMPPLSSNNGNSSFKATNGNQTMSLKASPSADDDNHDAFVAAAVADNKSPAVAPAASTPVAAINTNVRLANSSTPVDAASSPVAATATGIATITITTPVSAYKRRDPLKRPRAMSIQTDSAKKVIGLSRGGTGTPRARPVTLTDGMRLPAFPVSCYEDLVVTKEEFETAALEFERLFSGASA